MTMRERQDGSGIVDVWINSVYAGQIFRTCDGKAWRTHKSMASYQSKVSAAWSLLHERVYDRE